MRRLTTEGQSEKDAVELAGTVDRDRASLYPERFDVEWPARFFNLMINSGNG